MRTSIVLGLIAGLFTPSLAGAQDSVLASTERIAEGIELQRDVVGTRRSGGRVALGLAIAGARAVMLLIDPQQPSQPSSVSRDTLVNEAAAFIGGSCGSLLHSCEFTEIVVAIEPDLRVFETRGVLVGGIAGAAVGITMATRDGRTVYAGQFKPFKERSPGLKYGGAALAITGALIAGFWSDVPVMNALAVAPTVGGLQVGTSIGF